MADPSTTPTAPSTTFVDPDMNAQILASLLPLLQNAASPDALEAQNLILRRIALEGDVVGSRVPPPRNISEIGGYINLLTTLKETAMRQQSLAGILGVAGPNPPLGWISNVQPLAMVNVSNDRPAGASQPAVPLTVLVRSDFVNGVQAALHAMHQLGGFMPFSGPSVIVPPPGAPAATPPSDMLLYCGRVLKFATAAALAAPQTDPLALIRATGTTDPLQIASNVLATASTATTPANYDALQCTATTSSFVSLTNAALVPIGPIMANAGFYPATPLLTPANNTETAWARLQNITGLVAGSTLLGDELSLLHRADALAASVFATMMNWVWNGAAFVHP
jgi:hypothetical protein